MNKLPIVLFICVATSFSLHSQIPKDFNFLNHASRNNEIQDLYVIDGEILAAHKFGVDQVHNNYQLDFNRQGCTENQKLIFVNDSTAHYASWLFNCSDGIYDGMRISTYADDTLTTDHYDEFSTNVVRNAFDITYDSTGGWWCFTHESRFLLHLNDGKIMDTIMAPSIRGKLFTSCNGDIYVLERKELFHFNGDTISWFTTLPRTEAVFQDGEFNYILDEDKLYKYDCTLENQLLEWSLPIRINSFSQLNFVENDKVYINELVDSASYKIYGIDAGSNLIYEYSGQVAENEKISGIVVSSDLKHLIYGQHYFELSHQTFYRNILTEETNIYPTVEAEISDFKLVHNSGDTIFDWLADSLVVYASGEGSINIHNSGTEPIYALDIYSDIIRDLFNDFVPFFWIRYRLDSTLAVSETIESDLHFIPAAPLFSLENMRLELTGANYKFLENGPIVIRPELTSVISELGEIHQLDIFPNPSNSLINLKIDSKQQIKIIDSQGRICLNLELKKGLKSINIESLDEGFYFVIGSNEEGSLSAGKFLKE